MNPILFPIVLPLLAAAIILLISEKTKYLKELLAMAASGAVLAASVFLAGQALFGTSMEFVSR